MNHELHHRRLTRGALFPIPATAIAMLLATAGGCAVSENPRSAMPATVAVRPPTAIVQPAAPPPAEAPLQQAAYASAEVAPLPEPQPTAAVSPQVRSAAETPSTPPQAAAPPLATEELPAPAPDCTLTLDEAIAQTLQSDPKLRAAMEEIRQAEGDFTTSSLPPNPTVQVNGVYLPLRRFTPERPGGPPELDVLGGYPIDWFVFGKRAAAMVNAQVGVTVSNADYSDQVRQRLANTASAFYDVLEARAMLQLADEDLANLKRVEQITLQGVKFGGSGTIEADRIRLSVLAAEDDACTRETTLKTAKAQFRAAIGRTRQTSATDALGNLDVGQPAAPLSLTEALALAERNRPDIISLRRQVAKAHSGIEVERTKARAQLTPSLGYSEQFQASNGNADAPSYTAQMAVTVPLFDRNQGNIAKAQSVLAQSCYNLYAQLVQTEADVEQAVGEFEDAKESAMRIGPAQLAAARSVRDRTVAAYGLGGKTLLDVLDAERTYRDTHRTYILGQSRYWHALHRLNAAVGQQVLK